MALDMALTGCDMAIVFPYTLLAFLYCEPLLHHVSSLSGKTLHSKRGGNLDRSFFLSFISFFSFQYHLSRNTEFVFSFTFLFTPVLQQTYKHSSKPKNRGVLDMKS